MIKKISFTDPSMWMSILNEAWCCVYFIYPYPLFLDQKPLSKTWCTEFLNKKPALKTNQGSGTSDRLINYIANIVKTHFNHSMHGLNKLNLC